MEARARELAVIAAAEAEHDRITSGPVADWMAIDPATARVVGAVRELRICRMAPPAPPKPKRAAVSAKAKCVARERKRELLQRLKAGPCADCGQNPGHWAMDFDHVRGEKKKAVSRCYAGIDLKAILDEIAKCELVCANCHRTREYRRKRA